MQVRGHRRPCSLEGRLGCSCPGPFGGPVLLPYTAPMRFLLIPTVTLALTLPIAAQSLEDSDSAMKAIHPEAISSHIRFLADDLLEGRGTGTRGHQIAAGYVAGQFEALGLEPASVDHSYFQDVPFRTAELVRDASSLRVRSTDGKEQTLVFGRDYLMSGNLQAETSDVTAGVVFAGFGVSAPQLNYDDYAGADVRGKIVLLLSGAPTRFPTNERAYFSSGEVKQAEAVRHGAIGILTLSTPTDEARFPFEKRARQSGMASMRWVDRQGTPSGVFPALRALATLSRPGAELVFAGAARSIDDVFAAATAGTPQSEPLVASVTIHQSSRFGSATSPNVIGVVRGSDAKLRNEYVVYSAHLDHLGIGGGSGQDNINNGAYDNASGIATLIEVARAFSALVKRPRRSIIFLACTGEEKGEEGSQYFAEYPPVPREALVADINMDMFLMLFPVRDLVPFGIEHSSLAGPTAEAAGRLGFELSPDPTPEEVRFIRSDQYAFVRKGIPAMILKAGSKSTDPTVDGAAISKLWLREIYHSPKDDMKQPFDFASGVRYAQMNFLVGYLVANGASRPAWNRGDFFGGLFASDGSDRP
jgi:Zn-dependent M28 family amino/carboxypeptidase